MKPLQLCPTTSRFPSLCVWGGPPTRSWQRRRHEAMTSSSWAPGDVGRRHHSCLEASVTPSSIRVPGPCWSSTKQLTKGCLNDGPPERARPTRDWAKEAVFPAEPFPGAGTRDPRSARPVRSCQELIRRATRTAGRCAALGVYGRAGRSGRGFRLRKPFDLPLELADVGSSLPEQLADEHEPGEFQVALVHAAASNAISPS